MLAALSPGSTWNLGAAWAFLGLPTKLLSVTASAGGISLIISFGNLVGFSGAVYGRLHKAGHGSFSGGFLLLALMQVLAGMLVLASGRGAHVPRGQKEKA